MRVLCDWLAGCVAEISKAALPRRCSSRRIASYVYFLISISNLDLKKILDGFVFVAFNALIS